MNTIHRHTLLNLLITAIDDSRIPFARRLALAWLASYPGDLNVRLLYAQILIREKKVSQAKTILESICEIDPCYYDAWHTLLIIQKHLAPDLVATTNEICSALDPKNSLPANLNETTWGFFLKKTLAALNQNQIDTAHQYMQKAIQIGSINPIIAITHLIIIQKLEENNNLSPSSQKSPKSVSSISSASYQLSNFYHEKWPNCIQFNLFLAQALMENGQDEVAVDIIHQCAAADVSGQVPIRMWGDNHHFIELWPKNLSIITREAVPAGLASKMGWNHLPGPIDYSANDPENIHAKRLLSTEHNPSKPKSIAATASDGRFPVYVIFSIRNNLEDKFGTIGAERIVKSMRSVEKAISQKKSWTARLIFGDAPTSYSSKNILKNIRNTHDSSEIKTFLSSLDAHLRQRGEMIGALLIVGGPDIVPFFSLPNPVEDGDPSILSDSPYGTTDDNYYVPEWSVGRIPDGANNSPDILINSLDIISQKHNNLAKKQRRIHKIWKKILSFIGRKQANILKSSGYTTEVWKRSSQHVFRTIGEPRKLLISPPFETTSDDSQPFTPGVDSPSHRMGRLMYFNLHGLPDSESWYGQRDVLTNNGNKLQPDYPVAFHPSNVLNGGKAPEVVLSEACFGAYIINKNPNDSLALKFLESGTQAFIGATATAYGTINKHLEGADLLGYSFWKNLSEGKPVGQSLYLAKIFLSQEVHRRQGFLDGVDKKTLISFVLFGDPLAQIDQNTHGLQPKSFIRPSSYQRQIKQTCDQSLKKDPQLHLSHDTLTSIKLVVDKYMPAMQNAELVLSESLDFTCDKNCETCPLRTNGAKSYPRTVQNQQVVTIHKAITTTPHIHEHYAHFTLAANGEITKIMISK